MKTPVALVECKEYDQKLVDEALKRALDLLGGIDKFIHPGQKVLLKINLLSGKEPEKAVTTHPTVLRGMIKLIKELGATPLVGDSPAAEGNNNYEKYLKILTVAGLKEVADETGTEILHFNSSRVDITNPEAHVFKKFTISGELSKADVLINMPKLKTHGLALLTGSVKNTFGCIPGMLKGQLHMRAPHRPEFSQMIVDFYTFLKPKIVLNIMDAVIGMEGNGPGSGDPREIGAILAGVDGVAVDSVACRIVGKDPYALLTCKFAEEQGRGIANPDKIDILGDKIEKFLINDFKVLEADVSSSRLFSFIIRTFRSPTTAKPVVSAKKCTKCNTCVENCPVNAMTMDKKSPVIDYNTCIRCYCCQEVCPEGAVTLKKGILYGLLAKE